MDVFIKDSLPGSGSETAAADAFVITTLGPDQPGLVNAITSVFQEFDVNVTHLKAVFKGGDIALDNIMIFEVDVPEGAPITELKKSLNNAAEQLGLEISIQHKKIFETMNRI